MSTAARQHTHQQTQDAQYYRRVLHDLIDMGTDLAHQIHQNSMAQAEPTLPAANLGPANNLPESAPKNCPQAPAPTPDHTIAFDRVARTIRRTIMLAQKLNEPVRARPMHVPDHHTAAFKRIARSIEDTIQHSDNVDDAESLRAECFDRLDELEIEDQIATLTDAELASLTSGEFIKNVCRDLGIEHVPSARPAQRRSQTDRANLTEAAVTNTVIPMRPAHRPLAAKSTDPP